MYFNRLESFGESLGKSCYNWPGRGWDGEEALGLKGLQVTLHNLGGRWTSGLPRQLSKGYWPWRAKSSASLLGQLPPSPLNTFTAMVTGYASLPVRGFLRGFTWVVSFYPHRNLWRRCHFYPPSHRMGERSEVTWPRSWVKVPLTPRPRPLITSCWL